MVFLGGGIFVLILISIVSLGNSIRKTARQLEYTAATLNNILDNDVRPLLNRGERVLGEFEDTLPLVKAKLSRISARDIWYASTGIGGRLERGLILWTLKEAWRTVRAMKKKGGS
jgi:hypothetical protein